MSIQIYIPSKQQILSLVSKYYVTAQQRNSFKKSAPCYVEHHHIIPNL